MNIDMDVEWIPIKIWSPVKLNRKLNKDSIKTETIIVGDNFEKINVDFLRYAGDNWLQPIKDFEKINFDLLVKEPN